MDIGYLALWVWLASCVDRTTMQGFPRDPAPDSTLAFLRDGYAFVSNRCDSLGSDVFEARLGLRPTVFLRGAEAGAVFYDASRFRREGAAPEPVKATLFGRGGVQGLDDDMHRVRKAMFMSLMTPRGLDDLAEHFARAWRRAQEAWAREDAVRLFHETERVLCRAVCDWTGVPLPASDVRERSRQMSRMIDGAGGLGLRHWKGRVARKRAERWVGELVERVRSGRLDAPSESALRAVADHTDSDGEPLDARTAAVELINVIRPTVAIARYIAFLATALHQHPSHRDAVAGDDGAAERFVHEVRRYYPFFPMVGARVRESFEWGGGQLEEDDLVLLDLYGTNRHPGLWEDPEAFRPARFETWDGDPFTFVPQGGGDHHAGHRCAGEWVTVRLMKEAARMLTREMSYEMPEQDLSIDLSRIPAIPESRVVMAVDR